MAIQTVLPGICEYFGGPYDEKTRTYRTSPVAGVGVVRRAWPTDGAHADYFNGLPPEARTGSMIVVAIPRQHEYRRAMGGEHSGVKQVVYETFLHCYLRSRTPYAEDAQDDQYALRDALVERMRHDRTLGGCVFQAGEHITESGGDGIDFEYTQPATKAGLTKCYFTMRFAAVEFVEA
ncbi:hypothetical protein JHN59_08625 [Streptomyces sp. MBT49]|uniref:hypothetical protein n=1 Tax=unclassified Streptomyces TaxID=2593676 RepID=UPI001909BDF8|nr:MULTISPECIES: hypothetical protein [unclassified Streptomyces]MBK3624911.1 hypothetical protein [Streptomyces sp. MBT49]MBK3632555.1 hypothetical protein [Streptomyces sp. MBT97]